MALSEKHRNKTVFPRTGILNAYRLPSLGSQIVNVYIKGAPAGVTTGQIQQVSSGFWLELNLYGGFNGWVRANDILLSSYTIPVKEGNGKGLIDRIINNDFELYHRLLIIAENINRLNNNGISTNTHNGTLSFLIKSYQDRQNHIKGSKLIKFQLKIKSAYKFLVDKFRPKRNNIGLAISISIAIGLVAAAGTSLAIYLIFRPDYDASTRDLKVSKNLESALEGLDPKIKQSILDDLERQVDRAFLFGLFEGKLGSFLKIAKTGILIGGGLWLGSKLLSSVKKNGNGKFPSLQR